MYCINANKRKDSKLQDSLIGRLLYFCLTIWPSAKRLNYQCRYPGGTQGKANPSGFLSVLCQPAWAVSFVFFGFCVWISFFSSSSVASDIWRSEVRPLVKGVVSRHQQISVYSLERLILDDSSRAETIWEGDPEISRHAKHQSGIPFVE